MSQILADVAALVTDLSRMDFDVGDPMRQSKREAKRFANQILADAVKNARLAMQLPEIIADDFKESQQTPDDAPL